MQHEFADDTRMLEYLLGGLPAGERARLEEACLADDDLYEQLTAVETDLIDAYVRGELAGSRRERFEVRYGTSPRRRERIAFARQLAARAHLEVAEARPAWRSWWRWSPAAAPRPGRAFTLASAAVIVVLTAAGAAWWMSRPASRPESTQTRVAAPIERRERGTSPAPSTRRTPPAPLSASSDVGPVSLVLVPGSLRSPEGDAVLSKPADAAVVRIRVEHEGDGLAAYRVAISTPEGRIVWTQSGLQPDRPGAASLVVAVPADALRPGDYILTLGASSRGADAQPGDVAAYSFRVVGR